MTHRERFVRVLTGGEVDRVPFIKVFGGDNAVLPHWEQEHPGIRQEIDRTIGWDGPYRGWSILPVNYWLSRRGQPEVTEQPGGRRVYRWGDGTVEIIRGGGDYHHHTTEYPVKTRDDWERVKRIHLDPDDPARFPKSWDEVVAKANLRDYPLQLTHGGVYGFARKLMGDEALAYAFYDDPELVHEMMGTYTGVVLRIWEKLVAVVDFDLVEFWEDMASKNGSMVSPAIFREFMKPNYLKVRDFADQHGVPILLVDSDGNIDELSGLMLEAGVNAMYPYEVLAGNDLFSIRERYPGMAAIGGLDKDCMARGEAAMEAELEKARQLIRLGRFIPGPDHFVLSNVSFESYRAFMSRLKEIIMSAT